MKEDELLPFTFKKGVVVHVDGMPFELPEDTILMGCEGNYFMTKQGVKELAGVS